MDNQNKPLNHFENEGELQSIFDSLEPICLIDKNQMVVRVNKAMENFLGLKDEKYKTKTFNELFNSNDNLVTFNINHVFTSGKAFTINDYSVVNRAGKKNWYEITLYPILNSESHVYECLVYFKNNTELVFTKKLLLQQYKKLEEQQTNLELQNEQLAETKRKLDKEHKAIMDELSVAREVQQGIMPRSLPHMPGIEIVSSYEPVSHVGGDIYDVIDLGQNKLGIFIGDVSGHGTAAAFVGAMVKMAFIDHALSVDSPKELFNILNKNFTTHLKSGHYLTAFYGILDLNTYVLRYCKASHPQPLLISKNGEVTELETRGMFIGLIEEPGYQEKVIQLHHGDRLYFFTDGHYEIQVDGQIKYSYAEFKALLQNCHHLPKENLQSALTKAIAEKFPGYVADDDKTFLILEITGEQKQIHSSIFSLLKPDHNAIICNFKTEDEFNPIFTDMEIYLSCTGISDKLAKQILLSVIEIANNSLEHGHKGDVTKCATIGYVVTSDYFKCIVEDDGQGFKVDGISDPREKEQLTRERGRGIFIVKSYMDSVEFNETGNRVTILKRIGNESQNHKN